MATVLRFDDIEFDVLDSPTAYGMQEGSRFAQMPRFGEKDTLQNIGDKLNQVTFTFQLNYLIGPVRERINLLRLKRKSRNPGELIDGTGASEGFYVITDMYTEYTKLDSNSGEPLIATVELELLEYVDDVPEESQDLAARKKAFATVQANPIVREPKLNLANTNLMAMRAVVASQAEGAGSADAMVKSASIAAKTKAYFNQSKRAAERANNYIKDANVALNKLDANINNVAALKENLASYSGVLQVLTSFTEAPSRDSALALSAQISAASNNVFQSAANLTDMVALRQ